MRIISGNLRGSKIFTPEGDNTRPTTDRIKTTMFNVLSFDIQNRKVLDVFAGSGSLGLECISRGAVSATFLDIDKKSIEVINKNIEKLKVAENTTVLNIGFEEFFNNRKEKFDLIFLDPPYSKNLHNIALDLIIKGEYLSKDGIIVLEISSDDSCDNLEKLGLEIYKEKKFARTIICFIKFKEV